MVANVAVTADLRPFHKMGESPDPGTCTDVSGFDEGLGVLEEFWIHFATATDAPFCFIDLMIASKTLITPRPNLPSLILILFSLTHCRK